MTQNRKPPLGPKAQKLWVEDRLWELREYFQKCLEGCFPFPEFLVKEYNNLLTEWEKM